MLVETSERTRTGLRMRYGPGDVVLFRATMFEHFVTEFQGDFLRCCGCYPM